MEECPDDESPEDGVGIIYFFVCGEDQDEEKYYDTDVEHEFIVLSVDVIEGEDYE